MKMKGDPFSYGQNLFKEKISKLHESLPISILDPKNTNRSKYTTKMDEYYKISDTF